MAKFILFVLWVLCWILEATLIVYMVEMESTLLIVAPVFGVVLLRFFYTVFSQVFIDIGKEL